MSTKSERLSNDALPQRGFIYLCEGSLRYKKGARAWLFFAVYLFGAVWLEPGLSAKGVSELWGWLPLLAYLFIFPRLWRAALRWSELSWTKKQPRTT